eukprot:2229015-Heterocapsa_arctica.AAC.1
MTLYPPQPLLAQQRQWSKRSLSSAVLVARQPLMPALGRPRGSCCRPRVVVVVPFAVVVAVVVPLVV